MAIVSQAVATIGRSRPNAASYRSPSVNYSRTSSTSLRGGSPVKYRGSSNFTSNGYSGSGSSNRFLGGLSRGFDKNEAPQPYSYKYKSADEQGNKHYHRQEANANGTVRGSYGYTDVQGLYRLVDYIADANGFRASIKTNEPGTNGNKSPADVQMIVEQPPADIQHRYTTFRGNVGFRANDGNGVFMERTRTGENLRDLVVPTLSQPAVPVRHFPLIISPVSYTGSQRIPISYGPSARGLYKPGPQHFSSQQFSEPIPSPVSVSTTRPKKFRSPVEEDDVYEEDKKNNG